MKRWLEYVKPYKLYFILGPVCMLVEVAGEVMMPMFLGKIINAGIYGTLTVSKSIGYALFDGAYSTYDDGRRSGRSLFRC